MFTEFISTREVERARIDKVQLASKPWARSLLDAVGDLVAIPIPKDLLFELRFASVLDCNCAQDIEYEFRTGIGKSSIDFKFRYLETYWLVELVSIHESDAVRKTTISHEAVPGIAIVSQNFGDDPTNDRANETAELIRVQEKIGEKVFEYGKATKFPEPTNAIHMILVDCRGALGIGLVDCDYSQIAWGPYGFSANEIPLLNMTKAADGLYYPIAGLFERRNPGKYCSYLQSRIHMLGFVTEESYQRDELSLVFRGYWNPALLGASFPKEIFESFPLYRSNP